MVKITNSKPILGKLHKLYPKTRHYLNFSNPLELLVATVLSAQVRDSMVNAVTPALFSKYKTARNYAEADAEEIQKITAPIPFFRNKTKAIVAACRIIDEKYKGEVPRSMEELVELPGIGRKSANAILSNGFNIVAGITVDTHVIRVSYRLGLTQNKDPEKIERDLMAVVPKKFWKVYPRWMKELGRAICRAPKPLCSKCPLAALCPKNGVSVHG